MDFDPETFQKLLSVDLFDFRDRPDCINLEKSILKKYVPAGVSFKAAALADFQQRNRALLSKDCLLASRSSLLSSWRTILHRVFMSEDCQSPALTLNQCVELGVPGPGSSYKVKHTDFLRKVFDAPLTMTSSGLYQFYCSCIAGRWLQAENTRHACHSELLVRGSRLDSVPKDRSKDRTICVEPSLNMFFQLGAKTQIERLLCRFYNVDVSTQPDINKSMARTGSVDDSLATIDLKDASDSIQESLIQFLLPKQIYRVLDFIRSKECEINGEWERLHMFSTMGCGFTFPLMTLLFCTLLEAFTVQKGIDRFHNGVSFAVFGDDIILPSAYAEEFCAVLADVGFVVNTSKTYIHGPFRESCGGDYVNGRDVRGVYIKRMNHESDVYTAFNRLTRWSCRCGVPLNGVLTYLKGLARFRAIPLYENIDGGFRIPLDLTINRRNKFGAVFYSKLETSPCRYRVERSFSNPDGAMVSALGGYVAGSTGGKRIFVTIRSKKGNRYRVVRRTSPCWDYTLDPVHNARDLWLVWSGLLSPFPISH